MKNNNFCDNDCLHCLGYNFCIKPFKKNRTKNNYQVQKARAEEKAIQWQHNASEKQYSYGELYEFGAYFERLAKRYGLIKEFRKNGII